MFHADLSHSSVHHGYELQSHQVIHHPPPVSFHGPSHHDVQSSNNNLHFAHSDASDSNTSSVSGYSCDVRGALHSCVKDMNSHIVEGSVTGGIVGAVDGAGIGALPGAVIGGFTSGAGHCAANVYDHLSGCVNW